MIPNSQTLAKLALSRPNCTLDIAADAGALRNPENANVTRQAMQACLDAQQFMDSRLTVCIPGGNDFFCDAPIVADSRVQIDGMGVGSLRFPRSAGILLGVNRAPEKHVLSTEQFVGADGRLDKTVGTRWGYRMQDHTIASLSGPFDFAKGDNWKDTSELTVDWCFDTTDIDPDAGLTFGFCDGTSPAPFHGILNYMDRHDLCFHLTVKLPDGTELIQQFSHIFDKPLEGGVHRVTWQVSLSQAKICLWLDGQPLKVADPLWKPDNDNRFVENQRVPFKLNGLSRLAPSTGNDAFQATSKMDGIVLGLMVSGTLRYQWGDKLSRVDGQAINDNLSYFQPDHETFGYFPMSDNPNDVQGSRCLNVSGQIPGTALFLHTSNGKPESTTGGTTVKGLKMISAGDGILLGACLDISIEDCDITSQYGAAIGSWNWTANYRNAVNRCNLVGRDAALYFFYGMWTVGSLRWDGSGRNAIWTKRTRLQATSIFIGPYSTGESFVNVLGGDTVIRDLSIDIEDTSAPQVAVFICESENASAASLDLNLVVEDLTFGTFKANAPIFMLKTGDRCTRGHVKVSRMMTTFTGLAGHKLLEVDDPNCWKIDIDKSGISSWKEGDTDLWPMTSNGKELISLKKSKSYMANLSGPTSY